MLPREADLVSEWTGLSGEESVKRLERSIGLDAALYKTYILPFMSRAEVYCSVHVTFTKHSTPQTLKMCHRPTFDMWALRMRNMDLLCLLSYESEEYMIMLFAYTAQNCGVMPLLKNKHSWRYSTTNIEPHISIFVTNCWTIGLGFE